MLRFLCNIFKCNVLRSLKIYGGDYQRGSLDTLFFVQNREEERRNIKKISLSGNLQWTFFQVQERPLNLNFKSMLLTP